MDVLEKNESYLKQISIDDVEVDMYIEDVLDGNSLLLISANKFILNREQIDNLKNRGVKSVYINTQKGKDFDKKSAISDRNGKPEEQKCEVEYYRELNKAIEVHQEGIIRATEVLSAIRAGQPFSLSILKSAAEDIVESVNRNPDALVSLSQIKGYDNYTFVHSVNVAILIASLCRTMGYPNELLAEVGMGGLLHDIGKMRVPESILNKPGKLTDAEFAIVKRHPEFGVEAIFDKRGISDITRKIVLQHHERYSGNGYPYGIKGERIHEVGLISAVADVYDAMTSEKVYRAAWTPQKALALIFQECDKGFSRRVVEHFTKLMGIYPVGSFVKLVSGEMGVVIRVDKRNLLAPVVLIIFDKIGRRLKRPVKFELWKKQREKEGEKYKIKISLNPKAFNVNFEDYIQLRV